MLALFPIRDSSQAVYCEQSQSHKHVLAGYRCLENDLFSDIHFLFF
jgi:hypothetical protein